MDSKLLLITPVPTQPEQFIKDAAKMFEAEALKAKVNLGYHLDDSVRKHDAGWLMFDPSRALQVDCGIQSSCLLANHTLDPDQLDYKRHQVHTNGGQARNPCESCRFRQTPWRRRRNLRTGNDSD